MNFLSNFIFANKELGVMEFHGSCEKQLVLKKSQSTMNLKVVIKVRSRKEFGYHEISVSAIFNYQPQL